MYRHVFLGCKHYTGQFSAGTELLKCYFTNIKHTSRWVGSVYCVPERHDASVSSDRLHARCLVRCFYKQISYTKLSHWHFPQSWSLLHLAKNDKLFTLISGIGYQVPIFVLVHNWEITRAYHLGCQGCTSYIKVTLSLLKFLDCYFSCSMTYDYCMALQLTMRLSKKIISQELCTTFCSLCYLHSCW